MLNISRILKKVILFTLITANSLAFVINSVDFNEKIQKNKVVEKKYVITNTKDYSLKYSFSVDDKDVSVEPQSFIVLPGKTKEFTIKVTGKKDYGVHKYMLKIAERLVDKNKENVLILNYNYNISQKYEIIK